MPTGGSNRYHKDAKEIDEAGLCPGRVDVFVEVPRIFDDLSNGGGRPIKAEVAHNAGGG
jgi:hypothetical protein